jgi:hypothetical protein
MSENKIQWERSSYKKIWEKRKYPRYMIYPNYMGTSQVQWYNINYYGEAGCNNPNRAITQARKLYEVGYSQSEAKLIALSHARKVEESRIKKNKKLQEEDEKTAPVLMLQRRNEKFLVQIKKLVPKPKLFDYDELLLEITHNGYQWISIGLTIDEARKTIVALQRYLEEIVEEKEES